MLAPYVYNANLIARDRASGHRVFELMVTALLAKGFALRDYVVGESQFEFLGMVLDGEGGALRRTPRRCWRL